MRENYSNINYINKYTKQKTYKKKKRKKKEGEHLEYSPTTIESFVFCESRAST
jgi:hypothetical protein